MLDTNDIWDQKRFIRNIIIVYSLLICWFFVNAIMDDIQFRIIMCTIVSALLLLSITTLNRSIRLTGELLLLSGFISINSEIYTNGGLTSYATVVLLVIPVFALPISGKRSAYSWLALSFLAYIGFLVAHENGVQMTHYNEGKDLTRRIFFDASLILFGIFTLTLNFMDVNMRYARKVKDQLLALREEAFLRHKAEQEAQKASEAKSFFLANMSHEIRTPLNGIVGIVDLLNDAPLEAKYKHYIQTLNEASHLLLGQVNDILDFSKIESGEFQLLKTQFSMQECLAGLSSLFKLSAEDKGLELHSHFYNIPDAVFSDEKCIRQLVCNITSNAIKYTDSGSIFLTAKYENNTLIFSCTDTGLGITEKAQEHLFEPFSQDYSEQKQFIQGTGLGLSITQSLCDLLEGKIDVKSEVGVGSTFTLTLPMEPRDALEKQFAKDHDVKEFNVLVAEDNPVNQMVIKGLLKKIGCTFHVCIDGAETLSYLRNNPLPHILLSDIQMPNMNGYQLIEAIRQDPKLQHLHVAALTANATAEEHQKTIIAGFDGFLTKPIERSKLLAYLSKMPL